MGLSSYAYAAGNRSGGCAAWNSFRIAETSAATNTRSAGESCWSAIEPEPTRCGSDASVNGRRAERVRRGILPYGPRLVWVVRLRGLFIAAARDVRSPHASTLAG